MDARTLKALEAQSPQTLAEWWCLLNRWGWPEMLPNPEERITSGIGTTRRWAIMCWIADRVEDKAISYEWNKDHMSKDEHEAWYRKFRRNRTRDSKQPA